MNKPKQTLLVHPLFVSSLVLLLLNDFIWKYTYHNWLTGKLSDFTGIMVLSVLLANFFPKKKVAINSMITLVFIYWKSPLSQSLIDGYNALSIPIGRVVDYTDLTALIMLPLAYRLRPVQYHSTSLVTWLRLPALLLTVFAITATSQRWPYQRLFFYPNDYFPLYYPFKTKLTEAQLLHKLDSLQISYHIDSVEYFPAETANFFLRYQPAGDSAHLVPLNKLKDTTVLYKHVRTPYYVIREMVLEKDTLRNIHFTIENGRRKRTLTLTAVTLPVNMQDYYTYQKDSVMKKYQPLFKSIITD